MSNAHPFAKTAVIIFLFLALVSIACATFSGSDETSSLAATQTSLAQTSTALQSAASQPTDTQAVEPAATEPPAEPAVTTEAPPVETEPPPPPEPGAPTISASINTNCREGPSQDYKVLGYLIKGQTSEVQGRDSSKNWWYIKNPEKPNSSCWVWVETTTVSGDTSNLPVITPVPLPEPAHVTFTVSFADVSTCGGDPFLVFQVRNTSDVKLESLGLTIDDLTEGRTVFGPASHNAPFLGAISECPPGADSLPEGAIAFVGGKVNPLSLPGAMMRALVRLCSGNNLDGVCTSKNIDFVMPFP